MQAKFPNIVNVNYNIQNNDNSNHNNSFLLKIGFNLLTNIISFMNCKDRCLMNGISLYIYNICQTNLSKYHCIINPRMVKYTYHISQFYPTMHLQIYESVGWFSKSTQLSKAKYFVDRIIQNSPNLHTIEFDNQSPNLCKIY